MTCRLFGAKPLPEPMLKYCQLNLHKQTSIKLWPKFRHFHLKNAFENGVCQMADILSRYQSVKKCRFLLTWTNFTAPNITPHGTFYVQCLQLHAVSRFLLWVSQTAIIAWFLGSVKKRNKPMFPFLRIRSTDVIMRSAWCDMVQSARMSEVLRDHSGYWLSQWRKTSPCNVVFRCPNRYPERWVLHNIYAAKIPANLISSLWCLKVMAAILQTTFWVPFAR